jgi:hypothetical protein
MKLSQLHEGRDDEVMQLIKREMWPIAKRLQRPLKNGQVATLRDKDGSVLRDSAAKAIEIIGKYRGNNAAQHIRAIEAATDYKEVQRILTNVLLKSTGDGVVR